SAFDAFRSAAQLDTSFALAHYRVAQAANWAVPPGWNWDSILIRSRLAAAHASRLAPRARLLVQAYDAWTAGSYDDAERGYRAVVRTYPDDVEAWYGLGEVLFHTNPVRGRPFVEAGEPFRRVLALEPQHQGAMTHLLRVLVRERQRGGVDSLVARLDAVSAPPRTVEFHALRAFAFGDDAERDRAFEALRRTDDDEIVRVTANRVAIYAGNESAAARAVSLLLDRSLPADVRAHALLWLAELEVAHGRWRAAEPYLSVAAILNPGMALEEQAILAALPFSPAGVTRAAVAESALARWDAAHSAPSSFPWFGVYNGLHAHLRVYLLGLLELRQGKTDAADRWAGELAALPGSHEAHELGRGLAESLRAHEAAATGQSTRALAHFDAARLRVSEGLLESQVGSQAYERFARAELLFRLGRWRDALPWYASLGEISIDGLIYLAPAQQRQGEIYDRLGDRRAAAVHYVRFLELWRDADPELTPAVQQARTRLLALNAGP
ncbi:MAG TPA: tetratricopeptide repeat protein, partial [Gemmatimonadaceae bacterium]|nr:tetratricopeptide repeat protein [Gemmatimonadaceae bacterium]